MYREKLNLTEQQMDLLCEQATDEELDKIINEDPEIESIIKKYITNL